MLRKCCQLTICSNFVHVNLIMGIFIKNKVLKSGSSSIVIPAGDSATRPDSPTFGSFRYNTDLGKLEYFNGTAFKAVGISGEVTLVIDNFTGDGSTSTFTMSQIPSSISQILVFIGSVYQIPTTNYTILEDDITFTSDPPLDEVINIIHNLGSTSAN